MERVKPAENVDEVLTGDQKRVATPADAIANGADYLVIGRQVTRAEDPQGELLKILEEIHTFK